MLHASLSASLGSLFVLLAGANVWVMLHASSRSKDHAAHTRLMWAHRLGGYAFILLFCLLFYFMALRIKGAPDELPPRLTFHIILALLLIPILHVPVADRREGGPAFLLDLFLPHPGRLHRDHAQARAGRLCLGVP